jgi:hypothetical protein
MDLSYDPECERCIQRASWKKSSNRVLGVTDEERFEHLERRTAALEAVVLEREQ